MKETDEKKRISAVDSELILSQLLLEHDNYRQQNWEQLKHLRSDDDTECAMSFSIPDAKTIQKARIA